jgi:hypothetical protein
MAAGFTLRTVTLWSRVVAVAFAGLSMIANFLFLPYCPTWSSVIIALDVIVIWALCIYDRDAAYGGPNG